MHHITGRRLCIMEISQLMINKVLIIETIFNKNP